MVDWIINLDANLTLAINGSHYLFLDAFAMIVTSTVAWIPIGIFLCWYIYKNYGFKSMLLTLGSILLCVLVADTISSGIVKPLVARWRPSQDPGMMYAIDVVNQYRGGRYGFFSSHAANTCSVAVFLCMLFKSKSLTYMFMLFSLVNCWSRIYLGVHYFGDVIVGFCFGALVGLCIHKVYVRYGGIRAYDKDGYVLVSNLLSYVAFLLLAWYIANFF